MHPTTLKEATIPEISVLLSLVKSAQKETYYHEIKVGEITKEMLSLIPSYSEEEKTEIVQGALLHDVGKIYVPFNLTQSPDKLTDIEMDIVKTHPLASYEFLKDNFGEVVRNIAIQHHEFIDGCGYPYGLYQGAIQDYSLLVQCADIYEALISKRTYKQQSDFKKAFDIMDTMELYKPYYRILKEVVYSNSYFQGGEQNG